MHGRQRLGCLGIPCSAKLVVLGAVGLVGRWVVSGISAALEGDFGCVGAVINSQRVSVAFSSVIAAGTTC